MDNNLPMALILMLSIQAVLVLAQVAIITPEANGGYGGQSNFSHGQGTLLCDYDAGNCADLNTASIPQVSDPANTLLPDNPQAQGGVFTDIFTSIKNAFQKIPGVSQLINVLSAPANILGLVFKGDLAAIGWALSALWYGTMIFLIAAFFWGR